MHAHIFFRKLARLIVGLGTRKPLMIRNRNLKLVQIHKLTIYISIIFA